MLLISHLKMNYIGFVFGTIYLAVFILLIILLYYVYEMASERGRSLLFWIVFSVFLTPVLSIILLACIGETEEKRRKRLLKDEEYLSLMRKFS